MLLLKSPRSLRRKTFSKTSYMPEAFSNKGIDVVPVVKIILVDDGGNDRK